MIFFSLWHILVRQTDCNDLLQSLHDSLCAMKPLTTIAAIRQSLVQLEPLFNLLGGRTTQDCENISDPTVWSAFPVLQYTVSHFQRPP